MTQPVPSEPEPGNHASPISQPWERAAPLSQPDPAAFSHVDPLLLTEGGVTVPFMEPVSQPLYPNAPSDPPPPPLAPSEPSYYPLLMPTHPVQNTRRGWAATGVGLAVGIILGMVCIGVLAFIVVQSGIFARPATAAVTTIITTGGKQGTTPTQVGKGTTGTATPTVVVTTTPGIYATVTPLPIVNPTPGTTVSPGPTPLPGATATPTTVAPTATTIPPTATAIPPTATPLPPLNVSVVLSGRDHKPLMLQVQTAPNASLSISVVDCDGVTDPGAPTSGMTDDMGNYQFQWPPRHPNGCNTATATVTATLGNQSGTGSGTGNV